jgi:hypothetical protein
MHVCQRTGNPVCLQPKFPVCMTASVTHRPTTAVQTPSPISQESATPETPVGQGRGQSYRSPSRVGKRAAVAWLEPEAVKQLNMVAIQRDTLVQHILVEAINDWFARNGLPRFDENTQT